MCVSRLQRVLSPKGTQFSPKGTQFSPKGTQFSPKGTQKITGVKFPLSLFSL
jgi:hypothetical protein